MMYTLKIPIPKFLVTILKPVFHSFVWLPNKLARRRSKRFWVEVGAAVLLGITCTVAGYNIGQRYGAVPIILYQPDLHVRMMPGFPEFPPAPTLVSSPKSAGATAENSIYDWGTRSAGRTHYSAGPADPRRAFQLSEVRK